MFVKCPTSATVAAFTAIRRLSVNAVALIHFAMFRFSSELYRMFQYSGPQQDPLRQLLFTALFVLILFVEIKPVFSLK